MEFEERRRREALERLEDDEDEAESGETLRPVNAWMETGTLEAERAEEELPGRARTAWEREREELEAIWDRGCAVGWC